MKKYKLTIILCLLSCLVSNHVNAQADNSFSYQGELIDNGSPANDDYDFTVVMVDGVGAQVGNTSTHLNVPVENGLFNLNVLIGGLNAFDGFENYFFEVSVRKSSVGGNFTVLSPLQTLQSVPLATNLVNGGASNGQVLTFNGFQWAPADPQGGAVSTPWSTVADGIDYSAGNVNVGGLPRNGFQSTLQVTSNLGEVAAFDGGDQTYVTFSEEGVNIGYIGSFTVASGTQDNDFDIGTFSGNSGSIQLVTNGSPKLTIRNNGDLKQPGIENNGMMKAMIAARCVGSTSSINRSFNGVNDDSITIADGPGDALCEISFPYDINNRYWQASAVINSNDRGAHCALGTSSNQLRCYRYDTSTGNSNAGEIMVLVY